MFSLPRGRISGSALHALVRAARATPAKHVLARILRKDLGIDDLRALPPDQRRALPTDALPLRARADHARGSENLGHPRWEPWPRSSRDLASAFREGRTAPGEVLERSLRAARDFGTRRPPMNPIMTFDEERAFADASAAAERLRAGRALGPLDGVPVAIKEEIDVQGLPTRLGTAWMSFAAAQRDAAAVARLRAAGAVIVGQTPMTEYGMSPLGGNPHRIMPRNAHDLGRLPGGSSSGSGVAVATGIVPLALGLDGGGSVRIPACYNGVFGLKPTFGRVPTSGHGLGAGSTVVHIGPIGASSFDLAAFVDATAGADDGDPASLAQPRLDGGELVRALGRGVRGLRIGVLVAEIGDARPDVAAATRSALAALEREGAVLVEVDVPLARRAPAIGYLTIGLETYAGVRHLLDEHAEELGLDNQLLFASVSTFAADDYLDAQRLRAALREQTRDLLAKVDVLALPTTQATAPPVTDDEADRGFVDPPALDATCRFAFLGNLTGLPAGTAPIGRGDDGLPVGVQIVGDAWDEAAVLQVLGHLERMGVAKAERPATHIDLLG